MNSAAIEISMPNGEAFAFLSSARGPEGIFRFRWSLAPGKTGPPQHMHPHETETFRILSGTIRIWLDGQPRDYSAGDVVAVRPGVMHRFLNPGDETVVIDVSLDGTRLEDTLIGMAVHLGDRAPTAGEILRQVVGQVHDEAVGGRGVAGVVARQVARAFVGLGVRGFKAPPGWDT